MLRAAETDTLSAEFSSLCGVARGVGVGTDETLGELVSKFHDCSEVAAEFGFSCRNLTVVNITERSVERNPVAFLICLATHLYGLRLVVYADLACAGHAALTHAAGNHSSVAGHTAAHCEDTLSHSHTAEVFG